METGPAQPGKIFAAVPAIMKAVGAVGKDRTNTSQGYKFRGIADVYKATQQVMAEHGVFVTPHHIIDDTCQEVTSAKGAAGYHVRQRVQYRFYADDGSWFQCEIVGEAIDYGDKATNKAMSVGMKYAQIETFSIPEDNPELDPESADHDLKPRGAAKRTSKAKREEGAPDVVEVMEFRDGLWSLAGTEPALTQDQQAYMKILQGELKIPEADWRAKLFSYYGITTSAQLSQRLAVDWIGKLEKSKAARRQSVATPPGQT